MRKLLLASAILMASLSSAEAATMDACVKAVPNASLVGQSRLTYMMLHVYDARLYTAGGSSSAKPPLALILTYARALNGRDIADRSITEMRNQGFKDETKLAAWQKQLRAIMPNVRKGTALTGLLDKRNRTTFCQDGKRIAGIDDPAFGPRFFDIWLGPNTSQPRMRAQLLALKP